MSIFNKRSQQAAHAPGSPPAAVSPSSPIELAKKEVTPLSSMPFNAPEPVNSTRGQDSIGRAVKISGQISSREDLYVDGDVEGIIELQSHRLTIGPNGKLRSHIKAREVVILGNVQGNVDACDKLELRKDARMVGDIKTTRIVIEDGAYFKGNIDIVRPESAKHPGALQHKAQVTPVEVAAPAN